MSQIKAGTPSIKEEQVEKQVFVKDEQDMGIRGVAAWKDCLHYCIIYATKKVPLSQVPQSTPRASAESGESKYILFDTAPNRDEAPAFRFSKDENLYKYDAFINGYGVPDAAAASRMDTRDLRIRTPVLYKTGSWKKLGYIWGIIAAVFKYSVRGVFMDREEGPIGVEIRDLEVYHQASPLRKTRYGDWVFPGGRGQEIVVKEEEMVRLGAVSSQRPAPPSYGVQNRPLLARDAVQSRAAGHVNVSSQVAHSPPPQPADSSRPPVPPSNGGQNQPHPARDAVESRDADRTNVSTTAAHPPPPPPVDRLQPPPKPSTAERDRALPPRDAAVSREVVNVPAAHWPKVIPPRNAVRRARGLTAGPLKANTSRGNTGAGDEAAAEHRRYLLPEGDGKTEEEREEENSLYDTITPNDGIVEDESPEGDAAAAAAAHRDARRCELCWGVFCGCE